MIFQPIRPQRSPRVLLCNSGSRLMGQIPQFCYRTFWFSSYLLQEDFYGCTLARELVLLAWAAHICSPQGFSWALNATSQKLGIVTILRRGQQPTVRKCSILQNQPLLYSMRHRGRRDREGALGTAKLVVWTPAATCPWARHPIPNCSTGKM